jgi:hypothetical protein
LLRFFRTVSVGEFFSRARIDAARVFDIVEDPQMPSFDECEREVKRELAEQGIEFASMEHQARIQLGPSNLSCAKYSMPCWSGMASSAFHRCTCCGI